MKQLVLLAALLVMCSVGFGEAALRVCARTANCPNRPLIRREILTAKETGEINARQILMDQRFVFELGFLQQEFRQVRQMARLGGTEIEGVGETYHEIMVTFVQVLTETCFITLDDEVMGMLEKSFDETFETIVNLYENFGGFFEFCPQRDAIMADLQQGLEAGEINVMRMLRIYRGAFTELSQSQAMLRSSIRAREILDIKEIAEAIDEYFELFVEALEENCFISVRKDLFNILRLGFAEALEWHVSLLKRNNPFARNPEGCPNRDEIVAAVRNSEASELFSPNTLIFGRSAYRPEFGMLRMAMAEFRRRVVAAFQINIGGVASETFDFMHTFLYQLTGVCYIRTGPVVDLAVEKYFARVSERWVRLYQNNGGASLLSCPNRGRLTGVIEGATEFGYIDTTAVAEEFTAEFFQLNIARQQLLFQAQYQPIGLDIQIITETVQELQKLFIETLREKCYFVLFDPVLDAIKTDFIDSIAFYCQTANQFGNQNPVIG